MLISDMQENMLSVTAYYSTRNDKPEFYMYVTVQFQILKHVQNQTVQFGGSVPYTTVFSCILDHHFWCFTHVRNSHLKHVRLARTIHE